MNLFIKKFYYLTFIFLFSCQTVSNQSTADEILDVSAREVYNFLLKNKKLLEHKKIAVVPFYNPDLGPEEIPRFGLYVVKSITGLIKEGDNFLLKDVIFLYMLDEKINLKSLREGERDFDFLLMGEILVRDVSFEVIVKLLDQKLNVLRSYSFIMPLNESILKYLRNTD